MGILNNVLGINLTDKDPINHGIFNSDASESYINPPPGSLYMISETGSFMQSETTTDLMITE